MQASTLELPTHERSHCSRAASAQAREPPAVTLVDTSVWIDHFRSTVPEFVRALHDGRVVTHPFVVGELALGHLRHRAETLALLAELPGVPVSAHDDVLRFVEEHGLSATGIGWVEAHLLCATAAAGVPIWTRDAKLRKQAARHDLV